MESPDSEKWLEAMRSKMNSMKDNQVWNLVDLPDGVKVIENKSVFKRKFDMDGRVHIHKARLVAKGFRQIHGIDYDETFFTSCDPEGFVDPKNVRKVCKLQKSIYGLKQASRSWNLCFDEVVKEFGFIKNEEQPCLHKKASGSALVFLVLYVDDILLIGNDIPMLESVKASSMKDLGEADYISGIKIYRDRSKKLIGLSQSIYIDKMLKRFNMHDSKKGFLPLSPGTTLRKTQCPMT
ncbi:hypothetical protein U9M48_008953 [Paspalum notatum var. saurae]|uniref:Reverse transcriptase Ty1/copia-type domain-containing protein n=1 Tax=Paspalum notatum var. saurae TaxID=547442 RepID=A0AAQ3SQ25_PASNO